MRLVFNKLVLFLVLLPAFPQTVLPTNFVATGFGFQNRTKPTGWITMCAKTSSLVYACSSTDYTGTTSSTRAEVQTVIWHGTYMSLAGTAAAGAAAGASGIGGSFSGGGAVVLQLDKVIKAIPGLSLVYSVNWIKENVTQSSSVNPSFLQSVGSRTVFRVGLGKSW